jgi:putative addiction module CopG family antidote
LEAELVEVAIPKSLEALVRRKVEEGHYSTEAEVVAEALRLMQVRDEVAAMKRDRLKDALDRGYEDAMAGRVIQLDSDDDIDSLFAGSVRKLSPGDRR